MLVAGNSYDLAVIGGGINGVGIARDAAGRGLKTLLVERGDLGSATSSASSKLIHGGLRYLEQGQLRLVRESLREREILLKAAPHIVWPLEFILPNNEKIRSKLLLQIGLWAYDWLAGGMLPRSRPVDLQEQPVGQILDSQWYSAFQYSDCWVQDARLVVLNAMDARTHGAEILTRTRCVKAVRQDHLWNISLERLGPKAESGNVQARALVNAGGPWAASNLKSVIEASARPELQLVKGSHIVVKRVNRGEQAFIFQQPDKRVVFCLPFENDYTLIGTTELVQDGLASEAAITDMERNYLCNAVNLYLRRPIAPKEIVWEYAGVRALFDPKATTTHRASRDYELAMEKPKGGAPLLTVLGGKLTTYRALAEAAVTRLSAHLECTRGPWTGKGALPGGGFKHGDFEAFCTHQRHKYTWLPAELLLRYARNYGTCMDAMLEGVSSTEGLGHCFGTDLFAKEVDYLLHHEFASTAEDILWRRTKCGLRMNQRDQELLEHYIYAKEHGEPFRIEAAS